MNTRRSLITGLLIISFTIGGTIVHGRLTNRWGRADVALRAGARALTNAPTRFGPWVMLAEREFDRLDAQILDFAGALNRTYLNSDTGQNVALAIIVGPPGPTSTHTAEICYSSKGYQRITDTRELTIPAGDSDVHRFRQTLFESTSFDKQRLEVCYAWRARGLWESPRIPRVAFGDALRLFKIQVAANFEANGSDEESSVCRDFLTAFLPELDAAVFQKLED